MALRVHRDNRSDAGRTLRLVGFSASLSNCVLSLWCHGAADDPGTPYSRRSDKSSSEPGDVELIERTIGDGAAMGEWAMHAGICLAY